MLDANPRPLPLFGGNQLPADSESPEEVTSGWTLQKLGERHKQAASLLAQGCKRGEIAAITQYSEEYISFLTRQPLFRAYVKEMGRYSEERLLALFDETVDVIADTMRNGTEEGRLKAARLQMEATGRIGRERAGRDDKPEDDSLNALADRLVQLMRRKQNAVYEGSVTDVTDAEELGSSASGDSVEGNNDAPAGDNSPAASLPARNAGQEIVLTQP